VFLVWVWIKMEVQWLCFLRCVILCSDGGVCGVGVNMYHVFLGGSASV